MTAPEPAIDARRNGLSPFQHPGFAALAVSAALIAGCGEAGNQSHTPMPAATTESIPPMPAQYVEASETLPDATATAAANCSLHSVRIGSEFRTSRRHTIAKDLALLRLLNRQGSTVHARDFVTAGSILHDSAKDPLFAQAIVKNNDRIEAGRRVTTVSFLQTRLSRPHTCGDSHHLTKHDASAQYHNVLSIGQTVTDEMSSRVARQGGALLQIGLAALETAYDNVKNDLQ